ncbi:MAG TPA: hypothetical protein VFG24_03245 [Nitrosopumilaceae archaeon]|nr:hypothetical protein [Nitrosopumilaceae archaeon]
MDPKLTAAPIILLVISLSTIGLVNAESNDMVGQHNAAENIQMKYNQTGASCTQDETAAAKQGLADIQKKMADLRTQYYTDWQSAHNLGQYNGTFEQYSHEKISSSDISQIKSDYQKYSSILKSCGAAGHMMRPNASSTTCSQDDLSHARQELATTMQQGNDLKNKMHQQFKSDQASGQFNGTWMQYAKEKFYNLPEISQLKSTHDKYTSFLKSCFGNQVPYNVVPQNQDENYTSTILPTVSQSLPSISSPTDALGAISSHGIPVWVKGIAGFWAQGKISDDEFVSAIKFLVHQGIIKI